MPRKDHNCRWIKIGWWVLLNRYPTWMAAFAAMTVHAEGDVQAAQLRSSFCLLLVMAAKAAIYVKRETRILQVGYSNAAQRHGTP